MAGSTDGRTAYDGGGTCLSISQQGQVSLRIMIGFRRRGGPLPEGNRHKETGASHSPDEW